MLDTLPTPCATESEKLFRYRASENFAPLLESLGLSLCVTTYQAGKLVVIRARRGRLSTLLRSFEQAMGLCVRDDRMVLGTRTQVWDFRSARDLAARMEPVGQCDACYLPRSAHVTGDIQIHEVAVIKDEIWVVNTRFSCLATLHPDWSFVPRWRPAFISELAAEDRCHLNGFAVDESAVRYVTAVGQTDTPGGWRANRAAGGVLIDVASDEVVMRNLSMPHSPRVTERGLYLLDSGTARLLHVDPAGGSAETVAHLPGYARGLAIEGNFAFVGLSRMRERSTFDGLVIQSRVPEPIAGVAVVHLETGRVISTLEFEAGIEEIFDVQLLLGRRFPAVLGLQKEALAHTFVVPPGTHNAHQRPDAKQPPSPKR